MLAWKRFSTLSKEHNREHCLGPHPVEAQFISVYSKHNILITLSWLTALSFHQVFRTPPHFPLWSSNFLSITHKEPL